MTRYLFDTVVNLYRGHSLAGCRDGDVTSCYGRRQRFPPTDAVNAFLFIIEIAALLGFRRETVRRAAIETTIFARGGI